MKIIKRDGRAVDYNRDKIRIAIEKANREVREEERASLKEIKKIIKYIEDLGKKRMLVEDIQDIIEQKLMEIGRYELSKKYIVYRYTRALVRKQNTTDETILGLIRSKNMEPSNDKMIASVQRDYIAGEVSKDLTKRLLLPEKIVKADEEGIIHFHDATYFIQPVIRCCFINLKDMLDNGTVINGNKIDSPNSFLSACAITTQITENVISNQYGEVFVDSICLGKYLRKSYNNYKEELTKKYNGKISNEIIEEIIDHEIKKELKIGVKFLLYQINTLIVSNGKSPFITVFLHTEKKDPYIKENIMIIEEILKQKFKGIKNEDDIYIVPKYPKLEFVTEKGNYLNDNNDYNKLINLIDELIGKGMEINYISSKEFGNKCEGCFNQGIVSINLAQIGIIADGNMKEFWKLLDERLDLCKEALMCKHYALIGTLSDISPIHWQSGAIARLKKGETIDKLLYGKKSKLTLGYVGLKELSNLMISEKNTNNKIDEFEEKVIKHIEETIMNWKDETNIEFTISKKISEKICKMYLGIDKDRFGIIKDVTDKELYTN